MLDCLSCARKPLNLVKDDQPHPAPKRYKHLRLSQPTDQSSQNTDYAGTRLNENTKPQALR